MFTLLHWVPPYIAIGPLGPTKVASFCFTTVSGIRLGGAHRHLERITAVAGPAVRAHAIVLLDSYITWPPLTCALT